MKVLLCINGKKWKEEKAEIHQVDGIVDRFKRTAQRLGGEYEIYLIAKSMVNSKIRSLNYHDCMEEEKKTIQRPPAVYSNSTPYGIAKEVQ